MRGALTPNQNENDKSKPTNLKSVSTFSGQCCLSCVFRLLTWLILHFFYEYVGACYGRSVSPPPSSKIKEKNVEVRARFQQINAS